MHKQLRYTKILADESNKIHANEETLAKPGSYRGSDNLFNVIRILACHASGVTKLPQKQFDQYKN